MQYPTKDEIFQLLVREWIKTYPNSSIILSSGCDGGIRVEHYGMEFSKHGWPDQIGDTSTPQVMWDFLSQFAK